MNHKDSDPEQNRDIHFSVDSAPMHSRRRALKAALAGGAAITAGSVSGNSVPAKWVAPAVESVLLPVHAATSGASRVATCCVDYCNLSTDNQEVTVSDASYCDGVVTVNGGGGGSGSWGGSGAVTPEQGSIDFNGTFEYEGTFEFTVVPDIPGDTPVVISGVVSCSGIVGSFGDSINFSGEIACG